jgi:hypothetical protein
MVDVVTAAFVICCPGHDGPRLQVEVFASEGEDFTNLPARGKSEHEQGLPPLLRLALQPPELLGCVAHAIFLPVGVARSRFGTRAIVLSTILPSRTFDVAER